MFAVILTAFVAAAPQLPAQQPASDPLHVWVQGNDPAALESWVKQRLASVDADVTKLLAVTGPRTIENTLRLFDDAQSELAIAGNNSYLIYSLADTAPMRDKGQALSAVISSANTDLSLNQKVYTALSA
ncbi:MAG: hypothetical protein WBQ94_03915, partial [Terracidiphilus sp.]